MRTITLGFLLLAACSSRVAHGPRTPAPSPTGVDTTTIGALARELSSDAMRGRGAWTPENEAAARRLAQELVRLGAQPIFGNRLLVPFIVPARPADTVYNVAGMIPGRGRTTAGDLIGLTAHLDHLGVGPADASGDSIYNGFLDAALPIAMVLDVARRYAQAPGDRPLLVLFFNLEEQGLLGSKAMLERPDARAVLDRLRLLIGVDAGSPAGEAVEWQLMGARPDHPGARIADSLARARGWTTTATAPRPISDVFLFAERGVPILFPIPGNRWKEYTEAERDTAMSRFDYYHQPADEWRPDFPMTGTLHYADWLWSIVREATRE